MIDPSKIKEEITLLERYLEAAKAAEESAGVIYPDGELHRFFIADSAWAKLALSRARAKLETPKEDDEDERRGIH